MLGIVTRSHEREMGKLFAEQEEAVVKEPQLLQETLSERSQKNSD
jgi:hypothetical protein